MENNIHLQVYRVDAVICNSQVNYVELPIAGGPYGILSGHAPMMAQLTEGVAYYKTDEEKHYFAISGGVVRVENNEVVVLARTAELAETIDIARAQSSEKRARERLRAHQSEVNMKRAEISLNRALVREKAYDKAHDKK